MWRLHLAGVVALGSLVPAALTVALVHARAPRLVVFLAGHAALAGMAVAIATSPVLAKRTTGLLGKDPTTGRIPAWSLLAFGPYHAALAARLAAQRARRAGMEPPFHALDFPGGGSGWFLGAWPGRGGGLPAGTAALLDVTAELPRAAGGGGQAGRPAPLPYLCLRVWDTWAPDTAHIEAALAWAAVHEAAGGRVYVHCANGHGRSAVLAVARVLAGGGGGGSVDGAVAVVTAARPRARLNGRQRRAVVEWWAWRKGRQQGEQQQQQQQQQQAGRGGCGGSDEL